MHEKMPGLPMWMRDSSHTVHWSPWKNVPISGPIFQEKVNEIVEHLGHENFRAPADGFIA